MKSTSNKIAFQIAGIVFLIVIVLLVFANFQMYQKKKMLAAQIVAYQKKIDDIKKNNKTLNDEIANANNVDYLEKVAYEQGMAKTGEKEVIFVTPEQKEKAPVKTEDFWSAENWFGWIGKLWNWLKSKF